MPRKTKATSANIEAFSSLNRRISLRDLVALADTLPVTHIGLALSDQMRAMLQSPNGGFVAPRQLRRWVIIMALINRLLFEAAQLPKDPDYLL